MQIGRDDAALYSAVDTVTRPVSRPFCHRRQRLRQGTENCSAAVILETGQRFGEAFDQRCGGDLADRALRLRRRRHVENSDPVDALTGRGLIPVTKHLDRRADREHRCTSRNRLLQTGIADQMFGGQSLCVILGAAECVQIELRRHRIVEGNLDNFCINSPQPQPLSQHHGVAAVSVGAHHVGQHQSDPHR